MKHRLYTGDALAVLRTLPAESVHAVCTSPPYWGLRDYGAPGQLGMEATPGEYVARVVEIFGEVRRVLRSDGTLWLNLGDCYVTSRHGCGSSDPLAGKRNRAAEAKRVRASHRRDAASIATRDVARAGAGLKYKDLVGIPWRVALALQADGWWLRRDCVWEKPNAIPESVADRPSGAHEYVFLLTKAERYFYDQAAVRTPLQPGTLRSFGHERKQWKRDANVKSKNFPRRRQPAVDVDGAPLGANLRSVWRIATVPSGEEHYSTFPPALPERCVLLGTSSAGACTACGAPLRRVERRQRLLDGAPVEKLPPMWGNGGPGAKAKTPGTATGISHRRLSTSRTTTGWAPTCGCGAGVEPCVVLDPFAGTATTGIAAVRLGRSFVGAEINEATADRARRRLASVAPLLDGCLEASA